MYNHINGKKETLKNLKDASLARSILKDALKISYGALKLLLTTGAGGESWKEFKAKGEMEKVYRISDASVHWVRTSDKTVEVLIDSNLFRADQRNAAPVSGSGKTYDNGMVYVGEFEGRNRHGQGTCKFTDGSIYSGEWKDDKCNGHGTLTKTNGASWSGSWEDNVPKIGGGRGEKKEEATTEQEAKEMAVAGGRIIASSSNTSTTPVSVVVEEEEKESIPLLDGVDLAQLIKPPYLIALGHSSYRGEGHDFALAGGQALVTYTQPGHFGWSDEITKAMDHIYRNGRLPSDISTGEHEYLGEVIPPAEQHIRVSTDTTRNYIFDFDDHNQAGSSVGWSMGIYQYIDSTLELVKESDLAKVGSSSNLFFFSFAD